MTDLQTGFPVKVQGLNLNQPRISAVKGFRFFETSGDFTVESGGTPYLVSVESILGYFAKGHPWSPPLSGGR